MKIDFGAKVFGSAGKELGDVDAVVIDAGTKRMRGIVIGSGLFQQTKHMIEVSAIAASDDRGLHLDSTRAQAAAESETLASEEVALTQRVSEPEVFIPAAGVGGPIVADDPAVPGEYPRDDSFFDLAPIDPPPVEVESNLLENEVVLGRSSEVLSADGDKLGEVASFTTGDLGAIESVTLSAGLLGREHATFALADIGEFGTDRVHLTVGTAAAESRSGTR